MIKRLDRSSAKVVYLDVDGQLLTVRRKADSWFMRALGRVMGKGFRERFWTTMSGYTTWAPSSVDMDGLGREGHEGVIRHEAVHTRQARRWPVWFQLSYVLGVPLPVFFAYFRFRWEREAMLVDIAHETKTVEDCVQALWRSYGWCWPRSWMRRWFEKRLSK